MGLGHSLSTEKSTQSVVSFQFLIHKGKKVGCIKVHQKSHKRYRMSTLIDGTFKSNAMMSVFVALNSASARSITCRHCTTSIHSKGKRQKVSE